MTLGEGGQHPHTGEEVSELPEDIVKVPSPWVKPKDRAADQDEAHEWCRPARSPRTRLLVGGTCVRAARSWRAAGAAACTHGWL